MTSRIAALALAATLFPLSATNAQTREERGKQIVRQALDALGGQRFLEMRDRTETGRVYSFYREELTGLSRAKIHTRYLTAPASAASDDLFVRERQSFGRKEDKEDYAVLFDERSGYSITFRGARPLPQATVDRYRETTRRNILYLLRQRLEEKGLLIEHMGSEIIDNQPLSIVEITDSANITLKIYFHQSTHLPVRQIFFRRDPATRERIEEITVFGKYRSIDGVQWPFNITRHRNGEKIFEIFSESVAINQDLNDQIFTLPAGMKVLKPER